MRTIRRAAVSMAAVLTLTTGVWANSAQASAGDITVSAAAQRWVQTTGAGGRGGLAFRSGGDATGDVPFCQGDITSSSLDYDSTVVAKVTTACSSDPYNAPAWKQNPGDTFAGWLLDVNGDNDGDYLALMINNGSTVISGVVDAGGTVVCNGSPSWDADRTFGVTFPASCIGQPQSVRVNTGFGWDADVNSTCSGTGDPGCTFDMSPEDVFSEPVAFGVPAHRQGYWMIGRTGATYNFGDARFFGNTPSSFPVVDLEPTPSGDGYWTVNDRGQVFAFGDARFFGGSPALTPTEVVTSLSRTSDGGGYWLFTSRGRVITFGNARHFGDMSGTALNGPVLDSIPTVSGLGYYMVASDGGIFAFGDAAFFGSMGNVPLNAPVQSLVPDTDGTGYWLVASDGGIFAFEALFYGSMGSVRLNKPVTGMVGFGNGYLMVGEDGGIFAFGEAPFKGSLGNNPPSQPIVSVAVLNT